MILLLALPVLSEGCEKYVCHPLLQRLCLSGKSLFKKAKNSENKTQQTDLFTIFFMRKARNSGHSRAFARPRPQGFCCASDSALRLVLHWKHLPATPQTAKKMARPSKQSRSAGHEQTTGWLNGSS
ncbi:hypothetical protein [Ferribacterium limneticum]|uniref:hypothetical protein n=1 Tax=Ferribacterium limneticum TaxID=76259 RepID=UPI001CFB4463|nr:hypothetical protein [Ferribacterium limneticum]UCV20094.1 hypothetical protein KI610_05865 [Ferribacterium limneticum]